VAELDHVRVLQPVAEEAATRTHVWIAEIPARRSGAVVGAYTGGRACVAVAELARRLVHGCNSGYKGWGQQVMRCVRS
jgi:hypothetical protein